MSAISEINIMVKAAAVAFSPDGKTFTLSRGDTPHHAVLAWNAAHPDAPIDDEGIRTANGGLDFRRFVADKAYMVPQKTIPPIAARKANAPRQNATLGTARANAATANAQAQGKRSSGAVSTEWEVIDRDRLPYHRYGVSYQCPHCGLKWYKPNREWNKNEIASYNKEQQQHIKNHMVRLHKKGS